MRNFGMALILATLFSMNVFACSVAGKEPSTAEKFSNADHVLLAKVISAKLVANPSTEYPSERELVEAKYEAIEIFKGSAEPSVVREEIYGPGNCTLGLLVGNTYLFFLSGTERFAGWPSGSTIIWNISGTNVEPVVEELRKLKNGSKRSN